jgi:hypothetical protein
VGYAEARRAFLIGLAVRDRRLELGLSQVELAARAGMTQPALSRLDLLVTATRFWSKPFVSFSQTGNPLVLTAMFVVMVAALVVSVAAVVVRFARSSGEERLQLKWFAAAAVHGQAGGLRQPRLW